MASRLMEAVGNGHVISQVDCTVRKPAPPNYLAPGSFSSKSLNTADESENLGWLSLDSLATATVGA